MIDGDSYSDGSSNYNLLRELLKSDEVRTAQPRGGDWQGDTGSNRRMRVLTRMACTGARVTGHRALYSS